MPWRQKAKKDVASCDKPRGAAKNIFGSTLTDGKDLLYFLTASGTLVGEGQYKPARDGLEARSATKPRVDMS